MLTKMFTFIRSKICPFQEIDIFVPREGKILDLGCGHGIFSAYMAKESPKREILGVDPSVHKITIAYKTYGKIKNITFKNSYLREIKNQGFACIVIIDVLYLLSDKDKSEIFKKAFSLLKKNGLLIINNTSLSPSWLFNIGRWEELVMVKLFKYTFSDTGNLSWLSRKQYQNLLKKQGYKIIAEKLLRGVPYRQDLIVAQK